MIGRIHARTVMGYLRVLPYMRYLQYMRYTYLYIVYFHYNRIAK